MVTPERNTPPPGRIVRVHLGDLHSYELAADGDHTILIVSEPAHDAALRLSREQLAQMVADLTAGVSMPERIRQLFVDLEQLSKEQPAEVDRYMATMLAHIRSARPVLL